MSPLDASPDPAPPAPPEVTPKVFWEVTTDRLGGPDAGETVLACVRRSAQRFYLPASLDLFDVQYFAELAGRAEEPPAPRPLVTLGLHAEHLLPRGSPAARERIRALREAKCSCRMILLEDAALIDLKGGRVFHRLTQLRDEVRDVGLSADDMPSAEWMVENTPAQAICIPFGLADQTARYSLLSAAAGLGTAVFAHRPSRPLWHPTPPPTDEADLAYRAGEPRVALIEPLPWSPAELESVLHALAQPMPESERQHWWAQFQQHVPAPAKLRGGHPPEFGA